MPEWATALVGALLMLLCGLVGPGDIGEVLRQNVNVFAFFLGMMTLSSQAEAAFVFDRMAEAAACLARGSPARLFFNVFVLGTLISTFLTNDATALILTPVVFTLVTRLRLNPLPFVFACTFIADTASMTLPVSNPINMLLIGRFSWLGLPDFLHFVFLPSIAAISINFLIFRWIFRHDLVGVFHWQAEPRGNNPGFRAAVVCLVAVGIAFVVASALQPAAIGIVAVVGGLALLLVTAARGGMDWRVTAHRISWGIFPFIAGMFVMVRGIEHQGATAQLGRLLTTLSGTGTMRPAVVSTIFSAVGSNLINNVPMIAVMNSAIPAVHGASQHALVLGTLVGSDLGPNLTVVGSLSTMLWLLLLRQRGLEVSGLQYARLGVTVTPLMLVSGGLILGVLLR